MRYGTASTMSTQNAIDIRFQCKLCRAVYDSFGDFAKHAALTGHDVFVSKED
jgi:hypothetical protein